MPALQIAPILAFLAACGDAQDDTASCASGPAVEPVPPFFTEVSMGLAVTNGFGRAQIVDLDADGLDDLVATPAHDGAHDDPPGDYDKLALLRRGDGFESAAGASGLDQARVGLLLFGDVDDDGDPDAYGGVVQGQGRDLMGLWRNEGGVFSYAGTSGTTIQALGCGDHTCTPDQISGTFVDFDQDGVLDLYVGSWQWSDGVTTTRYTPPARDRLYRGLGDGTFEDLSDTLPNQTHPWTAKLWGVSDAFGRSTMGVAAADYDNDGDMDLFVANYGAGRPWGPYEDPLCEPPRYWDQDILWRNDGDMTFTDVADEAGVAATMRGPSGIAEEEPLVVGAECDDVAPDAEGTYPSPISGNSFTPQWADFDNDGDLDLAVGAISHPDYRQTDPTLLFVNRGDGTFSEESLERGLVYREDEKHVAWVDVDGDGLLDLATTGFRNDAENGWRLYLQSDDHRLVLQDEDTTGVDDAHQESAVWLDWDDDGDLDLTIAEDDGPARWFRNDVGQANHRVGFRLRASGPRDATGARILLTGGAGRQMRELAGPGGHYNPQASLVQTFGLGGDACAVDVRIRWPDGTEQRLGALEADRLYAVTQGQAPVVEREWPAP
ncbi:MAG: CRTAC1 family protein [Deltaproteobacteria bacterium]|nr:CRTAC1 family protein [Deltaproteobacteria bacterium]